MKNINVNFLELKGTSYDIGKQLGNIVLENNHLKNIFINSQAISDNEKMYLNFLTNIVLD